MSNVELTKKQTEVLSLIKEHIYKHGAPPTRAEIAKSMGFRSVNAAEDHLRALAKKGRIHLLAGTSRGIRLPEPIGVPVYKMRTLNSEENHPECYYRLDKNLFYTAPDYLIRAKKCPPLLEENDLLAVVQSSCYQEEVYNLFFWQNQSYLGVCQTGFFEPCYNLTEATLVQPLSRREASIQIFGYLIGMIKQKLSIPPV